MTMARSTTVMIGGLAIALLVTGCGPDPKDLQIETLQQQVIDLERENDSLRSRLAQCESARDNAMQRASSLLQENRDLRRQLMDRPQEPRAAEGWKVSGAYAWIEVGTDLLFDSGKASLKPDARAKLQEIANTIKQRYADRTIWVVGHTDTDPIKVTKNLWKNNLDLSCNRAMTVFDELVTMGLDPEFMVAGGQGEYNPIASNDTNAGKAQNRRVEIIAVPPRGTGTSVRTPGTTGSPSSTYQVPQRRAVEPAASQEPPTYTK